MAAFYSFSNHEKRMSPLVEAVHNELKQSREGNRKNNGNHTEQRLISQVTVGDGDDFSRSALSALDKVVTGTQRFSEPSAPSDMLVDCLASDHNGSGDSLVESYLKKGFYSKRELVFDLENGRKCPLRATLDTGCEVGNYISEDIVVHFGKRAHNLESDSKRGFSATYHKIQVIGEIMLFYTVGSFASRSKFFVAKGSEMGLILGLEELRKNNWLLLESENAPAQPIYSMWRSDKPDESNTAARAQQKAEVEKAEQERRKKAADARRAKKQTQKESKPSK